MNGDDYAALRREGTVWSRTAHHSELEVKQHFLALRPREHKSVSEAMHLHRTAFGHRQLASMSAASPAFATGLPCRVFSLPRSPLPPRRRWHHPSLPPRRTARMHLASASSIVVRSAVASDVRDVARVLVCSFCEDDSFVRRLRESRLLVRLGALGIAQSLYERLCYIEVVEQLAKRIAEPERKGLQKELAKRHVVLVAVDQQKGCVVGCIEMGVVNVPRLLAEGILNEVRQWEENVRVAGRELSSSQTASSESASSSNNGVGSSDATSGNRGGTSQRAPYIGNLAVVSSHRRLGIGSVLVREAQWHALREWGQTGVVLHVETGNEGAKRLYASLGFSCEMVEPEWYAEVGRARRMFLRSGGSNAGKKDKGDVAERVKRWEGAKVVGRRLGPMEYLRFCWWDLGRRRREREGREEGRTKGGEVKEKVGQEVGDGPRREQ